MSSDRDYRNLKQLREAFPNIPVIALTATATEQVRDDIVAQLDLKSGQVYVSSFDRGNLTYSVRAKGKSRQELTELLEGRRNQSTIIYCFSRQDTEELARELSDLGFPARPYHAGLDNETRRQTQEDFLNDRVPIVVATIAFGMGIDKPDIRLVVHYSLPRSLEGYYQETGRAGRDGLPSECVLFYAYADRAKQDYFINRMEDADEQRNARQKLARMVEYAQLPTCRRGFILRYFGEQWERENCGGCDACLESRDEFDSTEITQKILSAVVRTGERFGANHVIHVLTGSREKRVLELGHERLSVFGIAKDVDRSEMREIVGQLQALGLLARSPGEYPVLKVTTEGRDFLKQHRIITLPRLRAAKNRLSRGGKIGGSSRGSTDVGYSEELFDRLRALRRRLADAQGVPAFMVFANATLVQMASNLPRNRREFSRIRGVGKMKMEKYGHEFLEVIRSYTDGKYPSDRRENAATRQFSSDGGVQDSEARAPRRVPTLDITKELLSRGMSVSVIAQERALAESTIIGHLERMTAQGVVLDLQHVVPPDERIGQIKEALDICGSAFLNPAWEYLEGRFTYTELRLTRIYLRQKGQLSDQ